MYQDSAYLRFRLWYIMQPRAIRTLLAINLGLYVFWVFFGGIQEVANMLSALFIVQPPFSLRSPLALGLYSFLNPFGGLGGVLHLLFVLSLLYWFGNLYETMYRTRHTWILYIGGGLLGGVVTFLVGSLLGENNWALVGAMPAVLAILAAVAYLYPSESITLFFMIRIPIRWLLAGLTLLEASKGIHGIASVVAVLFGLGFAYWEQQGVLVSRSKAVKSPVKKVSEKARSSPPIRQYPQQNEGFSLSMITKASKEMHVKPQVVSLEEESIDALLDKINEKGYENLTDAEKKRLYEASKQ